MWVLGISRMCVFAMIMLGVAQLIEFLSGSQHQRGRILRQGDKLLFLYAGLLTLSNIAWAVVVDVSSTFSPRWQSLVYAPFLLGQILILVGAAYILRRVIPIIEESKTLV